jgi:hypothetical protein
LQHKLFPFRIMEKQRVLFMSFRLSNYEQACTDAKLCTLYFRTQQCTTIRAGYFFLAVLKATKRADDKTCKNLFITPKETDEGKTTSQLSATFCRLD